MVRCRSLRATGFARLLGMLALLAGIAAMHSAVFAVVGHSAGVHHTNAVHPEFASQTPDPDAAARAVPAGFGPAVTTMPDSAHVLSGHDTVGPLHRSEPDDQRIGPEPAWTQPHRDGTPTGHDTSRRHPRITTSHGVIDAEHGWTQRSHNDTLSGPGEDRPQHRTEPGYGRIRADHVWAPPSHNGTLPGSGDAAPHGRTEPRGAWNRAELVWTRPSNADTVPGHDQHPTGDAERPGNGGFFRSAGGTSVDTTVADDFGQTLVVAGSSDRWSSTARTITAVIAATGMPGPDCAGDGCDHTHAGMHGCVFILVVLAALIGLVLLYRIAPDRPGHGVALPRHWRPRPERPPPWTVLTLAELAILRI